MAEELSGRGAEFAVEFLVAFDFRHRPAEAFQGFRANLSAVRGFSAAMGSRWVHKRFGEHSGPLPRPFPSRVRFRAATVRERSMGLRPTNTNEGASGRYRGIDNWDRAFNRAFPARIPKPLST